MSQFFDSVNNVRRDWKKYDAWEQEQANEKAKKEHLAKTLNLPKDKVELTKLKAETVVRATEIMDTRSENNSENAEQVTGIVSAVLLMLIPTGLLVGTSLIGKKSPKIADFMGKNFSAIQLGTTLLAGVGTILWGNTKQKEASRIGRYQAKQYDLNDVKNFVLYTPEQIEQAKKIAKDLPDKEVAAGILKTLNEMTQLKKDTAAYKEWLRNKDPKEIEKLKEVNLSPEQLQLANEDKELIVDTVKEINIKAEEYSENLENAYDTIGTFSSILALPVGVAINKLLKALKVASPRTRNLVSITAPLLVTCGILIKGTADQKEAARVGRFKARQELLKDPKRLMAFSDEEMKQAENIKAELPKKGFFSKIGENFKFLKTYRKDKKEYKNYKKTTQKENEKLQRALKQVEVTESQKAEAKGLQENVFRAFDEVDEMSQRYSEDIEAGTEIAKQVGATTISLSTTLGLVLLGRSIVKGKFPISKTINTITNLAFDSNSSIKKAINNAYEVIKKQDKKTIQEFHSSLVKGKINNFLADVKHSNIKDAVDSLKDEVTKVLMSGAMDDPTKIASNIGEAFTPHLKQTAIAKWTRNMITECSKLWAKIKTKNITIPNRETIEEELKLKFNYDNYKTLINTGAVAGLPIIGTIVGLPYAFNAWLTNIQKKAGKIGIMNAMNNIDDPKVFANGQKPRTKETPETKEQPKSGNLLDKFLNNKKL